METVLTLVYGLVSEAWALPHACQKVAPTSASGLGLQTKETCAWTVTCGELSKLWSLFGSLLQYGVLYGA